MKASRRHTTNQLLYRRTSPWAVTIKSKTPIAPQIIRSSSRPTGIFSLSLLSATEGVPPYDQCLNAKPQQACASSVVRRGSSRRYTSTHEAQSSEKTYLGFLWEVPKTRAQSESLTRSTSWVGQATCGISFVRQNYLRLCVCLCVYKWLAGENHPQPHRSRSVSLS